MGDIPCTARAAYDGTEAMRRLMQCPALVRGERMHAVRRLRVATAWCRLMWAGQLPQRSETDWPRFAAPLRRAREERKALRCALNEILDGIMAVTRDVGPQPLETLAVVIDRIQARLSGGGK